jgi:hypothetical protein
MLIVSLLRSFANTCRPGSLLLLWTMLEMGFISARTGFGSVVISIQNMTKSSGEVLRWQFLLNAHKPHRKIPLSILTKNGHDTSFIERSHVLSKRETMVDLDTSKPFKLNAGTTGVCKLPCPALCMFVY